jgi:hypothetical protein
MVRDSIRRSVAAILGRADDDAALGELADTGSSDPRDERSAGALRRRMSAAMRGLQGRFSVQNYNEHLAVRDPIPPSRRDVRVRRFGYSRDGWPFTTSNVTIQRCTECRQPIAQCRCGSSEAE